MNFPSVKKAVVILVDGLGSENLRFRPGHAPFLAQVLASQKSIDCGFPSTTAVSLTSLLTGASAGKHGIIGYSVFDRVSKKSLNLLTGWSEAQHPKNFQTLPSIASVSNQNLVDSFTCGPAEYEHSGFTQLNNAESKYLIGRTIGDRFDVVTKNLQAGKSSLTYLYIPELDQAAHAFGSKSQKWLDRLEELDHEVARFVSGLDRNTGVVLTADHGIVDVSAENQIFIDDHTTTSFSFVGGDPRACFLYVENLDDLSETKTALAKALHNVAYVCDSAELIAAGWYGKQIEPAALALMPDLFVIARTAVAFYHRQFSKPQSLKMVGQHGSFSTVELKVPLLTWGAWA